MGYTSKWYVFKNFFISYETKYLSCYRLRCRQNFIFLIDDLKDSLNERIWEYDENSKRMTNDTKYTKVSIEAEKQTRMVAKEEVQQCLDRERVSFDDLQKLKVRIGVHIYLTKMKG